MLYHLKLQLPHRAEQHIAAQFWPEHLDGTFLAKLCQTLLQLFGAKRVLQHHRHEHFRCKKGQAGVEQVHRAVGDGVTQLHTAVGGKAHDVTRVGLFHGLAALAHEGHHRRGAQLLGGAHDFELHAWRVLARCHAHKSNAVAVVGVHIRLHLEHHATKRVIVGLHIADDGLLVDHKRTGALAWRWRQIDQRVQYFHHTKIIDTGAKEHGGLLTRQKRLTIKAGRCAGGQLHTLEGGVNLELEALRQRVGVGDRNRLEILGLAFRPGLKHRHGARAKIDDAAKSLALAHRPGHGHAGHAQFAFHFVQDVERVAHLAIHLVDKGDDGCVALAANLDQAACLRLHAVGSVNHHQRRVHRGQHAVGVLREVLVTGSVEQVDDVVTVHHLHDRGRHGNAALFLDFHPVRGGVAGRLARFHRAGDLDRTREK